MTESAGVLIAHTQSVAEVWRDNTYYENAETRDWLEPFWSENSAFRRMFQQLDTTNLVELACGHGRHTAEILASPFLRQPRTITILDVNEENVAYCLARFARENRVKVIRNNGLNFGPVRDGQVSAVFCYDAMVHFEYDCALSYVKDAHRILAGGGRALFHHSNLTNPGVKWTDNPHWRNFMSKELFAHVAQRTGFHVLEQCVQDWGTADEYVPEIDCLTLLEKPLSAATETRPIRSKLGGLAGLLRPTRW
jgi:SAM-dependent methyltransferase